MAHDVFISYASRDITVAEATCSTLESKDISCRIAPRNVSPGTELAEAIIDAIDSSRALLLMLSEASINSAKVIREVRRAPSKDIPTVAHRIDEVTITKSMNFFMMYKASFY